MILSNVELHKALDEGRLIIRPEPMPRVPEPGKDCPYNTHSVDLTLRPEITIPDEGKYTFNPSGSGSQAEFTSRNSEKHVISPHVPFVLKRGRFILGMTAESIGLPIPPNGKTCLAARIEGKSSLARWGLLIHFTAPTVHPGWDGPLTLEIINLGSVDIQLEAGMRIAQLIVEEVRGIPNSNPSQFQGQQAPEGVVRKRG